MPEGTSILYCHCAYADVLPEGVKDEVLRRLSGSRVVFEAVADLCGLSARRDPTLKRIAEAGAVKIAACYPRAVRSLFSYAGAPLAEEGVEIVNMRAESAGEAVRRLLGEEALSGEGAGAQATAEALRDELEAREPGQWIPWFPVIDYDRCKSCHQCLDFCLFGVYALSDDGRVEVENPANCKTYCPACARICPEVAIIFPKYNASPINGDEVSEESAQGEKLRVDPSALLRGDVYDTLRKRSRRAKARFSKHKDEARASEGPQMCECLSTQLQEQLGIPPEVLQSVSLEDIKAKLKAAKEAQKAQPVAPKPDDVKKHGSCE